MNFKKIKNSNNKIKLVRFNKKMFKFKYFAKFQQELIRIK